SRAGPSRACPPRLSGSQRRYAEEDRSAIRSDRRQSLPHQWVPSELRAPSRSTPRRVCRRDQAARHRQGAFSQDLPGLAMNPSSSAPPWLCVDDAVRCVLANASPLPTEPVPLALALGRVAAHDVLAPWDLPMGHVSIMDGYAARSVDLLSSPHPRLRVVGESAAGHRYALALQSGEAVRTSTGAWLPDGSDLVVPQEDTQRLGDDVHIDHDRYGEVRAGRWVRARGSDVPKGHRVVA